LGKAIAWQADRAIDAFGSGLMALISEYALPSMDIVVNGLQECAVHAENRTFEYLCLTGGIGLSVTRRFSG